MDEQPLTFACSTCKTVASFRGDRERMPEDCPTLTHPRLSREFSDYLEPGPQRIMQVADHTPFDDTGRKRNRVEELIYFAKRSNMQCIGIAFCVSMIRETQELVLQLQAAGLQAVSVCCRTGAVDYDQIGLAKAHPDRFAAICNPIGQARLLAEARADIVVNMGLCLGHDLLLQQYSKVPVTTLVVKDRALDHKPIDALRPNRG